MKSMTIKQNIWGMSGAFLAIVGGAMLAGCGGGEETNNTAGNTATGSDNSATSSSGGNTGSGVKLTGAGATFPYPIYSKWFEAYNKSAGVQVNYQSVGSGAGIKQLTAQTVDFGATDVPLSDSKDAAMVAKTVHIPTVAGAVAVAYNLPSVKSLKLSGPVLADIFLGTITKWNDPKIVALNAGTTLPATPIAVGHRADGSGTSYIFTSFLKAVSPTWDTKVGAGKSVDWPVGNGGKGNDGVASIVKQTPGGIGYVELAYAIKNKLGYAAIQNKSGAFVMPSVDSTVAAAAGSMAAMQKDVRSPIVNATGAGAYPIAGFTYILAYKQQKDAAKGKALTGLLKWAITDGQKMAKELYYAPLPAAIVAINQKTIDSIQ